MGNRRPTLEFRRCDVLLLRRFDWNWERGIGAIPFACSPLAFRGRSGVASVGFPMPAR